MVVNEPDILNWRKTPDTWEFTEDYGIPIVKGLHMKTSKELEFVEFHRANLIAQNKRSQKVVHFYLADYLFNRAWNDPSKYVNMLMQFKAVVAPDFSLYSDMPFALQIYNHYRKLWLHRYYQEYGIHVIPCVGWSTEESYDWCFSGMPVNSIVSVSSVGTQNNKTSRKLFKSGYEAMIERLKPEGVLFYGKVPDDIDTSLIRQIVLPEYSKRFSRPKQNG